jgi:hypothetical protein
VEVVLHGGGAASELVAGLSLLGSAVPAITSSLTGWWYFVYHPQDSLTTPTEEGRPRPSKASVEVLAAPCGRRSGAARRGAGRATYRRHGRIVCAAGLPASLE